MAHTELFATGLPHVLARLGVGIPTCPYTRILRTAEMFGCPNSDFPRPAYAFCDTVLCLARSSVGVFALSRRCRVLFLWYSCIVEEDSIDTVAPGRNMPGQAPMSSDGVVPGELSSPPTAPSPDVRVAFGQWDAAEVGSR